MEIVGETCRRESVTLVDSATAHDREDSHMKQANLSWKGCMLGLRIFGSFLGFVSLAFSQEIEPNNTCLTAQNVGTTVFPFALEGNLDSTPEAP
jgi:hypothetical protein